MGHTLRAVGVTFCAAGIRDRADRRSGVPTIPFFMAARVGAGPDIVGAALVKDPSDVLAILAPGEFSPLLATRASVAGLGARTGPPVALYGLCPAVFGPLPLARSATFARLLPNGLFPSASAGRVPIVATAVDG